VSVLTLIGEKYGQVNAKLQSKLSEILAQSYNVTNYH